MNFFLKKKKSISTPCLETATQSGLAQDTFLRSPVALTQQCNVENSILKKDKHWAPTVTIILKPHISA